MRLHLWEAVVGSVPPGAELLDLGCGTGIDAAFFAARGYRVTAADPSPAMVERARSRLDEAGLAGRAETILLSGRDLAPLHGRRFDAIYSDLGPLNCVPDLLAMAADCAALLPPGRLLIASVIGRLCPWEVLYYLARGDPGRAFLRLRRGPVPVPLNGHTVWTRYYTPRELSSAFAPHFQVEAYRGLCIMAPPPYLLGVWERFPRMCDRAARLDDRLGAVPAARALGDHFLITLRRV
jgi:SAM-dependent methyltransferase